MSQPEGFVDPDKSEHVCKLKRSIYGLKQSARCWNTTLNKYLKSQLVIARVMHMNASTLSQLGMMTDTSVLLYLACTWTISFQCLMI